MTETMNTNHCPKCGSEEIGREINIFTHERKENTRCGKCGVEFLWKQRKIKTWQLIEQ